MIVIYATKLLFLKTSEVREVCDVSSIILLFAFSYETAIPRLALAFLSSLLYDSEQWVKKSIILKYIHAVSQAVA
jgi:hypothetical protein